MGNCLISVHVTGVHHNGRPEDIDQMTNKFVDDLKAKGHNVTASTIVSGGEHDVMNSASRFPLRSERPDFYK
jgi:hypothetical protein